MLLTSNRFFNRNWNWNWNRYWTWNVYRKRNRIFHMLYNRLSLILYYLFWYSKSYWRRLYKYWMIYCFLKYLKLIWGLISNIMINYLMMFLNNWLMLYYLISTSMRIKNLLSWAIYKYLMLNLLRYSNMLHWLRNCDLFLNCLRNILIIRLLRNSNWLLMNVSSNFICMTGIMTAKSWLRETTRKIISTI